MKHQISLHQAVEMTKAYRQNQPQGMPLCETFSRVAIDRLLATPGCTQIRIYYGIKVARDISAILVATDAKDRDLLPALTENFNAGEEEDLIIVDDSFRCPPHCPPSSPLNT